MNLVQVKQADVAEFNEDQISLIKTTIAKGATDDELKLFLYTAQRLRLDPLAKQIHFTVRTNKKGDRTPTFITSIDGYRVIADRTGLYAGNDDPVYDDEKNPSKATVSVYKMIAGQRCAFTATARWDQYCPEPGRDFMWQKMPHLMLGKCAEALALRKAFPAELCGAYTEEEMEQAEPPTPIVQVEIPNIVSRGTQTPPSSTPLKHDHSRDSEAKVTEGQARMVYARLAAKGYIGVDTNQWLTDNFGYVGNREVPYNRLNDVLAAIEKAPKFKAVRDPSEPADTFEPNMGWNK